MKASIIKQLVQLAPKYMVMVYDKYDGSEEDREDGGKQLILEDDCGFNQYFNTWFFTAVNSKHLLSEMKRHRAPGRVMMPFATNLEPVRFIPNTKV